MEIGLIIQLWINPPVHAVGDPPVWGTPTTISVCFSCSPPLRRSRMVGPELLALVLQNRFLFLPELQSHFLTCCVFKQVFQKRAFFQNRKKVGKYDSKSTHAPHMYYWMFSLFGDFTNSSSSVHWKTGFWKSSCARTWCRGSKIDFLNLF